MIILTTTTLSFVLTASSVSPLTVVGSYVDLSDSTYSPNPFTSASNGTTPVTILAAPDVNYARQIKFLSINNPNVLTASLTLSHGTTQLIHLDLAAGSTLLYADGRGFSVMDSTGKIITAAGTSTLGGGSGIVSYTVGDLLYASTTTALAKLSDVATGSVLASGGVGVAPAWSATPNLTAISLGSNPATTGSIRLPNNTSIYFRDSAGTSDIKSIYFGSDNLTYFYTSVRPGTDVALNFGDPSFRWLAGYFNAVTLSGSVNFIDTNKRIFGVSNDIWIQSALGSIVHGVDNGGSLGSAALRWATGYFGTSLSVGTTFPTQGTIRLGNGGTIFSRNDANNADAKVLDFSSSTANTLSIGDGSFATKMIGSLVTVTNPLVVSNGLVGAPGLSIGGTTTGLFSHSSGFIDVTSAGTAVANMSANGTGLTLKSTLPLSWSSGDPSVNGSDVFLARDAANTLAQRNGVNAQAFSVYGTFTDASNYERVQIFASSGSAGIIQQSAGTGATRALQFGVANAAQWQVSTTGMWQAVTDNTNDIGANGANRPRDVYLGRNINVGNLVTAAFYNGTTNGIVQLVNASASGFTRLILGTNDATNNGVGLSLASGVLEVVRGDNSAYAAAKVGSFTVGSSNNLNINSTGKIAIYNGVTTAGWGVPAIQGSGRVTAQTAAVASVATYTVGAADGSFEVSGNFLATVNTSYTIAFNVVYTDEGSTVRTIPMTFTSAGGGQTFSLTNGNGPTYMGTPLHIRCKASTAITMTTTGVFTTVTYNAEGSIRQIA